MKVLLKIITVYVVLFLNSIVTVYGQNKDSLKSNQKIKMMKIEVWSDVMCPFCYIGKRKFEAALAKFEYREFVTIEWKSFELNPNLKTDLNKSIYQYLAETKGWTEKYARGTAEYVVNMAKEVGLNYDFDKIKVANSFDAHRFTHFAKSMGLQDKAEEALFDAYFTQGKDVSNHAVLIDLGNKIGLDSNELTKVLSSDKFATSVINDQKEAREIGVNGVPFFVMNRKCAVSGAQDVNVFLKNLEKSFVDWQKENPDVKFVVVDGKVCRPNGVCE